MPEVLCRKGAAKQRRCGALNSLTFKHNGIRNIGFVITPFAASARSPEISHALMSQSLVTMAKGSISGDSFPGDSTDVSQAEYNNVEYRKHSVNLQKQF